jgi:hypothetical protein
MRDSAGGSTGKARAVPQKDLLGLALFGKRLAYVARALCCERCRW